MSNKNDNIISTTLGSEAYYTEQLNARAAVPDHPEIIARWQADSAQARQSETGLLDLAFGSAPMEQLDFFPADQAGAPLLVFIHGGYWRSLDKSDFTFIVPAYRRAGFNVALTNYTLSPHASVEEITRQQLRALAWLYRRSARLDFDRNRIVIAGHSAGGHLAAMMMAAHWPVFGSDLPGDLIKAGVLMSGLYDIEPVRHAEFINTDLKLDMASALRLSPAWMPQPTSAPFITAVGDLESDEFKRQTALIASQWRHGFEREVPLHQENHFTICDCFGDESHPLFKASCELINSL
jgi:arylformamidase